MNRLAAARAGMLSAVSSIALWAYFLFDTKPVDRFPIPLWAMLALHLCGLVLGMVGGTIGWNHLSGKISFVGAWILLFPFAYFLALLVVTCFMMPFVPDF
jgi:hypothetical protein